MNPGVKTSEIGWERRCNRCTEWWPNDADFFYLKNGKPKGTCKACTEELRRIKLEKRRKAMAEVAS